MIIIISNQNFNYCVSSYSVFFQKAQLVRRLIKEDFDKCFENVDVLLTPTAPSTAKTISECLDNTDPVIEYLNDLMTIPANLAGMYNISFILIFIINVCF